MKDWMTNFPFQKLSIFAVIVVSFTYNVLLERDVLCSCKGYTLDCYWYMVLPFFIIFFLMIWIDKTFLEAFRICSPCCKGALWGLIFYHIFKAGFVGSLWVVSVLIDGDWYVCCTNNSTQPLLACKDAKNLTAEEKMEIAEMKNESRSIGFGVLLFILLGIVISACPWRKCSKCCRRRPIYYKLILKENKKVLKTTLREAANDDLKTRIRDKINGDNWEECFDVHINMISSSCKPKVIEQPEEIHSQEPNQQLDQQQQDQQLEQQPRQEPSGNPNQKLDQQKQDQQLEQQQDQQPRQEPSGNPNQKLDQQQQDQQLEQESNQTNN